MSKTQNRAASALRYRVVEDVLRRNIKAGRLPPGLVLLEGPIAEIFTTSRAPVQRALQELEADGLIHRFTGRGFLVGSGEKTVEPLRSDLKNFDLIFPEEADRALQTRAAWNRIYDTIEASLGECIVFGQFRIVESELAKHFDVSRTIVRDVLSRLQERGLVQKNQSSHWIAGPLTAKKIRDRFELRRLLEPPALVSSAPNLVRGDLEEVLQRFRDAESSAGSKVGDDLEVLSTLLIDSCVLTSPNEPLRDLIRNNLRTVLATERLLRRLGLPSDPTAIGEQRLVIELLLRDAVEAAAAMLQRHLEAERDRTIAQIKIVAVLSEPTSLAPWLSQARSVQA